MCLHVVCVPGDGGEGDWKDAGGTGMGEGVGAKDMSEQIQDEDQLLGAQTREQQEKDKGEGGPQENDGAQGACVDRCVVFAVISVLFVCFVLIVQQMCVVHYFDCVGMRFILVWMLQQYQWQRLGGMSPLVTNTHTFAVL